VLLPSRQPLATGLVIAEFECAPGAPREGSRPEPVVALRELQEQTVRGLEVALLVGEFGLLELVTARIARLADRGNRAFEALLGRGQVALRPQHARRDALGAIEERAVAETRAIPIGTLERRIGLARLQQAQRQHRERFFGERRTVGLGNGRKSHRGRGLVPAQVTTPGELPGRLVAQRRHFGERRVALFRRFELLQRELAFRDGERRLIGEPVLGLQRQHGLRACDGVVMLTERVQRKTRPVQRVAAQFWRRIPRHRIVRSHGLLPTRQVGVGLAERKRQPRAIGRGGFGQGLLQAAERLLASPTRQRAEPRQLLGLLGHVRRGPALQKVRQHLLRRRVLLVPIQRTAEFEPRLAGQRRVRKLLDELLERALRPRLVLLAQSHPTKPECRIVAEIGSQLRGGLQRPLGPGVIFVAEQRVALQVEALALGGLVGSDLGGFAKRGRRIHERLRAQQRETELVEGRKPERRLLARGHFDRPRERANGLLELAEFAQPFPGGKPRRCLQVVIRSDFLAERRELLDGRLVFALALQQVAQAVAALRSQPELPTLPLRHRQGPAQRFDRRVLLVQFGAARAQAVPSFGSQRMVGVGLQEISELPGRFLMQPALLQTDRQLERLGRALALAEERAGRQQR
jgi:hypothetical protein